MYYLLLLLVVVVVGGVLDRIVMVMVVTKQRLFQFLLALILVTLVVNGYTFFLFLTGYSSGSDFDPMSWASQGNKLVVENSSVPSIRFKVGSTFAYRI